MFSPLFQFNWLLIRPILSKRLPVLPLTGRQLIFGMALLALLILRCIHLQADPPTGISASGDLYTDEGWWATNATAHYLTGHWYIRHGYNPALLTPVLPVCEYLAFRLAGISLLSARLLNLLFFLFACLLLYRIIVLLDRRRTAYVSVWLLCASSLVFAFSRLALLEIPMTCFVLASLYCAMHAARRYDYSRYIYALASALCFVLAVLTKTTAVFAMPLIAFALLNLSPAVSSDWRQRLRAMWLFLGAIILLGGGYFALVSHHYPDDVQTFIGHNISNKTQSVFAAHLSTIPDAPVQDPEQRHVPDPNNKPYLILAGLFILVSLGMLRVHTLRKSRLYILALAWLCLYMLLLCHSCYFPARYFVHLVFPASILLGLLLDRLFTHPLALWRACALGLMLLISLPQVTQIIHYLLTPHYSLLAMAHDVQRQVRASQPSGQPVLLGEQADTIGLITGLPAINDALGPVPLAAKLAYIHPTHYIGLGKMPAWKAAVLGQQYQPLLLARYDVFGNYYTGQQLYLYRLVSK